MMEWPWVWAFLSRECFITMLWGNKKCSKEDIIRHESAQDNDNK